jgi:hypothetical protein
VKEETDALLERVGQVCAERAGSHRLRLPRQHSPRQTKQDVDQPSV